MREWADQRGGLSRPNSSLDYRTKTMPVKHLTCDYRVVKLRRILEEGIAKAREAGIAIIGGHSVEDDEPKYGLVVTGLVSPEQVLTNVGARPGDMLVLTKPIGTGILTTALKRRQLAPQSLTRVVAVMSQLNKAAAEALEGLRVHALTDVTGFGLLGHLVEMVAGSGVGTQLHWSAIPVQPEALALAEQGCVPGGTYRNLDHFGSAVDWSAGVSPAVQAVLADPQTSGGLLIAVAPEDVGRLTLRVPSAAVISQITQGPPGIIQLGDV